MLPFATPGHAVAVLVAVAVMPVPTLTGKDCVAVQLFASLTTTV